MDFKTERDYAVQTAQRKRKENPPPKVDAYVVDENGAHTVFGDQIEKGMIVEYDPAWAEPGKEEEEAKYLFVVSDMVVNEKGKGWAEIKCINSKSSFASIHRVDAESIRPASVQKVDAAGKTPGNKYFNGDVNEGLYSEEERTKAVLRAAEDGVTPAHYQAQVRRQVNDTVTVRNLGGDSFKGKITAITKDCNGDDVFTVESKIGKGLYSGNVLDNWMTAEDIQRDTSNADRIRTGNAHKYAKAEVLFSNRFGETSVRCHASIVDKLPEKTSRWSNGYAEMGEYEKDGKLYTIFKDRDDHGQFSYFAVRK